MSKSPKTVRARVTVYPRPEILDPQGKQIREALGRIGYRQVSDVRAGKSFELEIEAASAKEAKEPLQEMCRELLANPLIEDYQIEMLGKGGKA